jgi:hypothetical protein
MKRFNEAPGGRIISMTTGEVVLTIAVYNLTTDEASRTMAAVLTALEAAFAHPKAEAKPTA